MNKNPGISREEAEDIIITVPAFHSRAALFQHYTLLQKEIQELKSAQILKAQVPEMNQIFDDLCEELKIAKTAEEQIVKWLMEDISGGKQTVRAKYARKLAQQIQSGDHRGSNE